MVRWFLDADADDNLDSHQVITSWPIYMFLKNLHVIHSVVFALSRQRVNPNTPCVRPCM